MDKISLNNLIKILIAINAICIPIQASIMYALKLPSLFQLIYVFIIISAGVCIFIPYKKIIKSIDKTFVILFCLLILVNIISICINYDSVINYGLNFKYYVKNYSLFWDSPEVRMFNWGILRPIIFFAYICILFIFLNTKDGIKIHLKSLLYLTFLTVLYSTYQFFAFKFGLPFGAIFSGHDGEEITLFGMRRLEGIFFEPGPQASFLTIIVPILLYQLYETDSSKILIKKRYGIFLFILSVIIYLLTLSPIAFIAIILLFISQIYLNRHKIILTLNKNLKKAFLALLSISIFIFSFIIFINLGTENSSHSNILGYIESKIVISMSDTSGYNEYSHPDSRSLRNQAGMTMFENNPIFGVAPGGAITHYARLTPFTRTGTFILDTQTLLNTYIRFMAEVGIVGFIIFLIIVYYPVFQFIKNRKLIEFSSEKNLIYGLLFSYIFHIVLTYQANPYFWMALNWMIYVPLVILTKKQRLIQNNIGVLNEKSMD